MRYAKGFSFLQERECGVEKPLSPVAPHVLTEQEYYASLPIKELKIAVPNSLLGVYNTVNSLGK